MEIVLLDEKMFVEFTPQISDLFKTCFGQKVHEHYSEEVFKWRHLDNPYKDIIINVCVKDDSIISCFTGTPYALYANNQLIYSALTAQAATHPAFQGMGLFPKLGSLLTDHISAKGYQLIFGFPNHINHRIMVNKLGRKDVYEIPTMALDLRNKRNIVDVTMDADNIFDYNYDSFLPPEGLNRIQKSKEYLKWRYFRNPVNHYSNFVIHDKGFVSSFMVIKQYIDKLNIIDFQSKSPDEGEYMLQTAISYANNLKLDMVTTIAPRHTFYGTLCEKFGFLNTVPITYFVIRNLVEDEMKISTNYSDWYIQMGDLNIY